MKDIDVTIGIPAYNAEKNIRHLLSHFNSDASFTYEVIVINDGSNDGTPSIIKEISKNNSRIRYYTQNNQGVSKTRNRIIENAKGKLLTFIDSDDDIVEKNMKEFIENALKEYRNTDFWINIENKKNYSLIKKQKTKMPTLIEKEIINSPWGKIYKTKILKDNGIHFPLEYDLGEDLLFNICYFTCCKKIQLFNKKINIINKLETSLTRKARNKQYKSLRKLRQDCIKQIAGKDYKNKCKKAFEYIKIKNAISSIRKGENSKEDIKYIKHATKREYYVLNNIKTTTAYYVWFILSSTGIIDIYGFIRRRQK